MLRVAEKWADSDTGLQRRANEDAFFARAPIFAVADGMGGAQAGEVASHTAIEVLDGGLPDGDGSVQERLCGLVVEANARINELSRADDKRAGMGTTFTVAYVGEEELSVAHVGDSRMYRLRDGDFERLTEDHSLVEELVRQGKLTPEEADEHPQRSIITRALGPEAGVQPDAWTFSARDGDVYLLCSDGLTSMVAEARVGVMLREADSLRDAGHALIDAANEAGGRDNITVVLFRLEDVQSGGGGPRAAVTAEYQRPSTGGATAMRTEDVRTAVAQAQASGAERRAPRAPRPPEPRRRRRLRVPVGLLAGLAILVAVLLGGWYASQTVYFLGASDDGFVAVYRGLPYDLPAGLDLYSQAYVSGVPVTELAGRRRTTVTEHKLRSRDDAYDLVRALETGELAGR